MAKWANDLVMDAALDYIATATLLAVCSAQPTTYAELATTYKLADVVMDGADFSKANGDTNGRKVTVAAQNSVPVDTSGDATHVGLGITVGTVLVLVTTCTTQTLTSGNNVNIPAWDDEISDPT